MDRSDNIHPCPDQGRTVFRYEPVFLDPSPQKVDILGIYLGKTMDDVEMFSAYELTGVPCEGQYPQRRRGGNDRDVMQTDPGRDAPPASVKEQVNFMTAIDKIPYQIGKVPLGTVQGRAHLFDGEGDLHL